MTEVTAVKLPAGKYWVGDPCYAIPDPQWMPWLEAANYTENPRLLIADLSGGHTAVGVGTAHGDGLYEGSDGNYYPVDAGLIGATPVAPCAKAEDITSMQLVEFSEDFEVRYEDGTIHIGHIAIDTDPEDEDEGW